MNSNTLNCAARTGLVLLTLILGSAGIGCRSIYHETRASYPADPGARLQLRIEEAQTAEQNGKRAGDRLEEQRSRGLTGESIEPDVDRLEMATLEFNRRVRAVHEAATECDPAVQSRFATEIARLETGSQQMQETLLAMRPAVLDPSLSAAGAPRSTNAPVNKPAAGP